MNLNAGVLQTNLLAGFIMTVTGSLTHKVGRGDLGELFLGATLTKLVGADQLAVGIGQH